MATVLDKGTASKLRNSLRATPGVSPSVVQGFADLLAALQKPGVTEAEAEQRLRQWVAGAPRHAVTVLRSAALGSSYMRALPEDSWVLRAFGAEKR